MMTSAGRGGWRAALAGRLPRLRPGHPPGPQPEPSPTLPDTVVVQIPGEARAALRSGGAPAPSFRMFTLAGADQIARDLFLHGWHGFEPPLPDVFAACVSRSEGLVIDVGANTGFYSLVAVSASGTAVVHAFEPFPAALVYLRDNLDLNGALAERVTVFSQAVSDEVGAGVLHVPDPAHGLVETSCSLNGTFKEKVVNQVEVPVVSLDAHLEALGDPPVAVVKIDVESFEHRVLAGASRLLSEQRPMVFLEVLPHGDLAALEQTRKAHDYTVVRLRRASAVVGGEVQYDEQGWNQALVPNEKVPPLVDLLSKLGLPAVPAGTRD